MKIQDTWQRLGGNRVLLFTALGMAATLHMDASLMATASFTYTQPTAGTYEYDLTLNNTGTTTIGTFWFSWVPGAGFLSATPTNVQAPAGWADTITNAGRAVRWTTSTNLLTPGASESGFIFDSTLSPAALEAIFPGPGTGTGDPVDTFYVYIAAPLADPGFGGVAAVATPEPNTWLTLGVGLAGLAALKLRRR